MEQVAQAQAHSHNPAPTAVFPQAPTYLVPLTSAEIAVLMEHCREQGDGMAGALSRLQAGAATAAMVEEQYFGGNFPAGSAKADMQRRLVEDAERVGIYD